MGGSFSDSGSKEANDGSTVINIEDGEGSGVLAGVTAANRLKVDTVLSSVGGGLALSVSSKLRYDDMNASTGGVARDTGVPDGTTTTVYSYSGSGLFFGFTVKLESSANQPWEVYLTVDGEEIFGSSGILSTDMSDSDLYNFNNAGSREPSAIGLEMQNDSIWFSTSSLYPVSYSSSVVVKVKKVSGGTRDFRAGLAILTKET